MSVKVALIARIAVKKTFQLIGKIVEFACVLSEKVFVFLVLVVVWAVIIFGTIFACGYVYDLWKQYQYSQEQSQKEKVIDTLLLLDIAAQLHSR